MLFVASVNFWHVRSLDLQCIDLQSGELFDYIVEKGRLEENEARRYFQQIIRQVCLLTTPTRLEV